MKRKRNIGLWPVRPPGLKPAGSYPADNMFAGHTSRMPRFRRDACATLAILIIGLVSALGVYAQQNPEFAPRAMPVAAGNINPSAPVPTLGDTTDTFGTCSCCVSAVATRRCDNRGNTPATTASDNKTMPTIISRRAPRVPKNGGFPVDGSLCPINQLLLSAPMFIRFPH